VLANTFSSIDIIAKSQPVLKLSGGPARQSFMRGRVNGRAILAYNDESNKLVLNR
jgi:hypothetical protein